jgi:hypothetical protein
MAKQLSNGTGLKLGQSATDTVGLYGATPVAQQTVTAITDGSTGAAAATNGIAALTGTYNSTLLINAIATLADGIARMRTAMRNVGIVA